MAEVFCNQCGHRNGPGSNFCSSCGAALEPHRDDRTVTFPGIDAGTDPGDDEVAFSLDDLPADTGMLIVKRGDNAGSKFALQRDVTTAGRHPESDIFLDDITVSRRHVEIARTADGYVVRDVGSLNGTYLNRERIEEAPISNGDELQIGKFKLVFFVGTGQ